MKGIAFLFFITITGLTLSPLNAQNKKMKITIANKVFTATLSDTEASREFVKLLPMTVTMNEHNGNEKYYNLPKSISGKRINPDRLRAGDLMIWSSNSFVLFYAEGTSYYSYIRLGKIDNTEGLREAVGHRGVQVKLELQKEEKKKDE